MKKLLLLPLFLVVCIMGDTGVRVIAATAPMVAESTLANISTRAFVQTGDNVVIGGFIVKGAQPKSLIIRALGPELAQYGIPNVLANPTLELHDGTGALIASNNNWATTIIGGIITSNQVHEIQASGYAPGDPFESAIIADLPAGHYTAIVRGVNNMTGVALVEVYDLSPEPGLFLGNISTRGYVQTGDNVMIGGFTIQGTVPAGVFLRAIGPELSKYGVPNTLADPTLELYDSMGALIGFNDNWRHTVIGGIITTDQVGDILNSGLVPGDQNESVINATLVPGSYTAIVRGVNNTTGVALVEGHLINPTYTWTGSADSHWENTANWEPNYFPHRGDNATILSGTPNSPIIDIRDINDLHITLGNPDGGAVTLGADSVTFVKTDLTVTGGDPGSSPVNATLSCKGMVTFDGHITVEGLRSSLTIDAGDGTFTLTSSAPKNDIDLTDELETIASSKHKKDFNVLVTQESSLLFKGRNIVNTEFVEIEGAADIAEEVTLRGKGNVVLDSGGHLSINGTVEADQKIDFADGTGRIALANPTSFLGIVGFTPPAGARIDFPGIQAQSLGVHTSVSGRVLKLYAGPNQTGNVLAHINVQTIDEEDLTPTKPPDVPLISTIDFTLSSDGKGGTLVTYLPQGTLYLEQSMPVPVIALRGTRVSLRTIFSQSFGTTTPGFHSIKLLLPKQPENTPKDHKYWGKPPVAPAWFVNGHKMTARTYTVRNGDNVEFLVGNNISAAAQFDAQVTRAASGPGAEIVTYTVWTVDPRVAKGVGSVPGKPTPADIIASAHSLNSTFPDVPNTNLCNWIADNVAAAAGTTMPLPDAQLDPTNNVQGGFWRIFYTGARPNPVKNWFGLVRPGDIVRMQWFNNGGHSTSVLSDRNPDDTITVYDNGDHGFIGIHNATYQKGTNPASITIYRLDPNQQYLIQGTSLGEVIQGSVYNNLFKPGGGSDIIIDGPSNNEIQDIISNLNGITVRNFHVGDVLNFTNLAANGTTAQYDATSGTLSISRGGNLVATITMRGLGAQAQFSVTPNGAGSNISLLN